MGVGPSADPSAKFLPPSRRLKRRRQVAAVCYRIGKRGIEFLLVQTRAGRWIFPKGGVEPGLTRAQSAALEAFEEAGVHGRMEEIPFARYFRRPPRRMAAEDTRADGPSAEAENAVAAFLCEVSHLEPPQELNRNPTWLSAEKAKARLIKNRAPAFGAELARVVDRAAVRIQRLSHQNEKTAHSVPRRIHSDGLQKVRFEAHEDGRFHDFDEVRQAVLARYFLQQSSARASAPMENAVQTGRRKVPRLGAEIPVLRLGAGTVSPGETARQITVINTPRRTNLSKRDQAVRSRTDRS